MLHFDDYRRTSYFYYLVLSLRSNHSVFPLKLLMSVILFCGVPFKVWCLIGSKYYIFYRVCDRAGHSLKKWKTVSFYCSLQLQQILSYRSRIFSACSPKDQCPIIVTVSLYILFLDLCSILVILGPYLFYYLSACYWFPSALCFLYKMHIKLSFDRFRRVWH